MMSTVLLRLGVFLLAFLSFACLLGQFYSLWSMHIFGCYVLPPSTALLVAIAYRSRHEVRGIRSPYTWIVEGAIGGIVAAIAYDLYRLIFVLQGAPLFKVFPRFGELLLDADEPRWLVHLVGWAYHFSNGAALGIMFLTMVPIASRRLLLGGAIAWAMVVETTLLMTPYTNFFGLPLDERFLFLTITAHLVFGIILGSWCQRRIRPGTIHAS